MDNDTKAILKFVICIVIIAVLLIVWFNTRGAPAGDEEEIILTSSDLSDAISSKISSISA